MTANEIHEVVTKLIGPITPVGETRTDETRLANLLDLIVVIDMLLVDVDHIAERKDDHRYSVNTAGKAAYEAMINKFGITE